MRPIVRPGLHVLRRDLRTLQLGLEWPGLAAVVDSPAVRAVLDMVDGFRDVAGVVLAAQAHGVSAEDAERAVSILIDSGVLVDQAVLRPASVDPPTWATWWLLAGPRATARTVLEARRRTTVHVLGSGRLATRIESLLTEEQVPLVRSADEAGVVVLSSDRELPRGLADDAMRRGTPYLCVSIRELVGLVGPFVVPGTTACLRCVDLADSHRDPCWPTVVGSATSSSAVHSTGAPTLLAITAGYAAHEIAIWASGFVPASCDHVVELPHGMGEVQTRRYEPHPECGCGWQPRHETMTA